MKISINYENACVPALALVRSFCCRPIKMCSERESYSGEQAHQKHKTNARKINAYTREKLSAINY